MNKEIRAEVLVMIDTLQGSSPEVDKHILRIKPLLDAEYKLFLSALLGSINPDRDPNWRKNRRVAGTNAERAVSSFMAALSALYEEDPLGAAVALQSLDTPRVPVNPSAVSAAQPAKNPFDEWAEGWVSSPRPKSGESNRPENYGQIMNMDLGNNPEDYGLEPPVEISNNPEDYGHTMEKYSILHWSEN